MMFIRRFCDLLLDRLVRVVQVLSFVRGASGPLKNGDRPRAGDYAAGHF